MLGTTKPPYSLALIASLLRDAGCEVRLMDMTAERLSVAQLIARLDADRFRPTLILFPSTTPTLDADVLEMAKLKARYGAPMFCFGPHASTTPEQSMQRAPTVDGMFVGEPEDAALQLARLGAGEDFSSVASLTWRDNGTIVPHRAHGSFTGFLGMPYPAWDLVPIKSVLAAAGRPAVRDCRGQSRLSVLVRFLRRAGSPGPQVPRAQRQGAGRRNRARLSRVRHRFLLPLGRHRDAERQELHGVLRRADRPQAADSAGSGMPAPTTFPIRRSSSGCASPAAGCWRWASSPSRTRSGRT